MRNSSNSNVLCSPIAPKKRRGIKNPRNLKRDVQQSASPSGTLRDSGNRKLTKQRNRKSIGPSSKANKIKAATKRSTEVAKLAAAKKCRVAHLVRNRNRRSDRQTVITTGANASRDAAMHQCNNFGCPASDVNLPAALRATKSGQHAEGKIPKPTKVNRKSSKSSGTAVSAEEGRRAAAYTDRQRQKMILRRQEAERKAEQARKEAAWQAARAERFQARLREAEMRKAARQHLDQVRREASRREAELVLALRLANSLRYPVNSNGDQPYLTFGAGLGTDGTRNRSAAPGARGL